MTKNMLKDVHFGVAPLVWKLLIVNDHSEIAREPECDITSTVYRYLDPIPTLLRFYIEPFSALG